MCVWHTFGVCECFVSNHQHSRYLSRIPPDLATPFLVPKPDWSDKRNCSLYGHARLYAVNATHMHWQWFPTEDSDKLEAADDKWITRDI